MNESSITYWRLNKTWQTWLGKIGRVTAATTVLNGLPNTEKYAPYAFALVTVGHRSVEVMGVAGEKLMLGDKVRFVLRKIQDTGERGVVFYGLKVQKCV